MQSLNTWRLRRQVSSLACEQAELWSPGVMTLLPFMTGSNFQLTGSRTSHPDACTIMEHAHPSYAHIKCPDVTRTVSEV